VPGPSGAAPIDVAAQLVALCCDATDPLRVARFWAAALHWDIDEVPLDEVALVPNDGTTMRVVFRPGAGVKSGQNRIHLDLTTSSMDDQNETVARLLELGGRHIDVGQGPEDTHVVLADPEGNELCVLAPNNNFLADSGRLGAVNCDGTRATGCFWSAVLGLPLVWDQDEETAIRVPSPTGPMITWSGPPLIPKLAPNRLQLHISPSGDTVLGEEIDRVIALGATRVDAVARDRDRVVMADPDGNEFCVVRSGRAVG
jgi:predicted enzyme related to lactoylglutathione lyase/catechol 2,3-dioxygenase-like lactoylglutathione lyase family enzyme